jgi:hypothetical protein
MSHRDEKNYMNKKQALKPARNVGQCHFKYFAAIEFRYPNGIQSTF